MQVRRAGSKCLLPSLEVTGYLGKDGFWSPPDHIAGRMGVFRCISLSALSHRSHTAQTPVISKLQHSDVG